MSTLRKIQRNKLKEQKQNNNIQKEWRKYQVGEYSIQGYCEMFNKNNPKKGKMKPKDLFYTRNVF